MVIDEFRSARIEALLIDLASRRVVLQDWIDTVNKIHGRPSATMESYQQERTEELRKEVHELERKIADELLDAYGLRKYVLDRT